MGGHINPEDSALIDEAIEITLDEFHDDGAMKEYLRSYLRKRWPFIVKFAVTLEASA
jgi:hypothetical protein